MIGLSVKLSRLRDIGWSLWDPIGLDNGDWTTNPAADEYDSYLKQVVGLIRRGGGVPAAIAFLVESDRAMSAGRAGAKQRATATAEAIEEYLDSLPAPPGGA